MKSPLLLALALLMTLAFAGTADAGETSSPDLIKINCGDPVFKQICDTYCSINVPRIMAGPVDWLIECVTN